MNTREQEKILKHDGEVVVRKLEEWAAEIPDKACIYYGEENTELSYRELNDQANIIGHNLHRLGVKKGDRVSVFLRNPYLTIKLMFGIWKIGAVFCPINFHYKGRLLSYQIKDTCPRVLISEARLVPVLNDIKTTVNNLPVFIYRPKPGKHDYDAAVDGIELDKSYKYYPIEELLTGNPECPEVDIEYYDTANIIYTSGTTGPAKGVVQPHRWINQYSFRTRAYLTPEDVVYNDLPLYHVAGAFANCAAGIWRGCTIALYDSFSRSGFWERINRSRATRAIILDVMLPWLMNVPETPQDRFNTLNKAHMQPLPDYHQKFAARFGIDFVTCGFGQTEAGIGIGGLIEEVDEGKGTPPEYYIGYSHEQLKEIARANGVIVIAGTKKLAKGYMGTPSMFHDVAILNEHDEVCPPGEVGQLAFRPRVPHLMFKEYHGKLAETYEVCRNLWFHTGDAAFRDEEGRYYFYDRIGGFIRTRGENISSFQVEDIINSHPDVVMSAAFPVPALEGEEEDIAIYVVLKKGRMLNEEQLRDWIKKEMPKYMYPRYIRFIDELPRTPTNKVEKYKLRELLLKDL